MPVAIAIGCASAILQRKDQRQRHFAFLQIAQHGLAQLFERCREIEQIVHQLKRQPRIPPIFGERFFDMLGLLPEHGAEPRTAAEEARRLAIGEVDRFRLGEIDAPKARELQQFAFDHVLREVDQDIEHREIPLAQRHLKRLHVQPVAREHAHVVAPARVRARAAAARFRAVDHVVVDQRRAVDHLDHRAEVDRAFAAIARRARAQQQQRRPQPLSAALAQVARNLRHRLDRAAALPGDLLFDQREVVSHQIEYALDALGDLDSESHPLVYLAPSWGWSREAGVPSLKNRRKFAAVVAATSSAAKFLTFAKACATSTTKAGSLRLPRRPCGGRKGESVSVSRFSSGSSRATSRKCCIFG